MVYQEAGIHHISREESKDGKEQHLPSPSLARSMTKMVASDPAVLKAQRNRKQRLKTLLHALQFGTKSMKDIHDNFVLMSDGDDRKPGMVDFADFCACSKVSVTKESKELFSLFQHELFDGEHIDYRFFLISLVSLLGPSLEMKIGFAFEVN